MNNIEGAYRRFCRERFPLPSEKQVAELEDRLNVTLPSAYRSFILQYNGGFFDEPYIISPPGGTPTYALDHLNGIGASHPCAELGSDVHLFQDNDPPQLLPIGYTLANHLLFMVTDPTDEMPGWIGVKIASSEKSFWLADDIEEFFGLLRDEES